MQVKAISIGLGVVAACLYLQLPIYVTAIIVLVVFGLIILTGVLPYATPCGWLSLATGACCGKKTDQKKDEREGTASGEEVEAKPELSDDRLQQHIGYGDHTPQMGLYTQPIMPQQMQQLPQPIYPNFPMYPGAAYQPFYNPYPYPSPYPTNLMNFVQPPPYPSYAPPYNYAEHQSNPGADPSMSPSKYIPQPTAQQDQHYSYQAPMQPSAEDRSIYSQPTNELQSSALVAQSPTTATADQSPTSTTTVASSAVPPNQLYHTTNGQQFSSPASLPSYTPIALQHATGEPQSYPSSPVSSYSSNSLTSPQLLSAIPIQGGQSLRQSLRQSTKSKTAKELAQFAQNSSATRVG